MTTIPDPGVDFEGCINALVEQVSADIENLTEDERAEYFLLSSIKHLVSMYDLDAPPFLIKMAHRNANKHLKRLQTRARALRPAPE